MKKGLSIVLSTAMLLTSLNVFAMPIYFENEDLGNAYEALSATENKQILTFDDYTSENDINILTDNNGADYASDFAYVSYCSNTSNRPAFSKTENVVTVSKDPKNDTNNVLKITSDNASALPMIEVSKGVGALTNSTAIPHVTNKQLSVSMRMYIDENTAKGYNIAQDNAKTEFTDVDGNAQNNWHGLDAANYGFVSLLGHGTTWGNRGYSALATIAFNSSKSATWDGTGDVPVYLFMNAGSYDTNAMRMQTAAATLPVGRWFNVEFLANTSAVDTEDHTVPISVYIDGKAVVKNYTTKMPYKSNNAFEGHYQSVAFNPQAWTVNSQGEVKPTMYVDDISANYITPKAIDDKFNYSDALNTNLLTATGGATTHANAYVGTNEKLYAFNYAWTNSYVDTAGSATENKVEIVNAPEKTNDTCLKLTSDRASTFPVIQYVDGYEKAPVWNSVETIHKHKDGSQLVVSADMYFDKATALNYLPMDYTGEAYSFGFMSVLGKSLYARGRANAVATLGLRPVDNWTDADHIPAYINYKGVHSDSDNNMYSTTNMGQATAAANVDLPTDKWFNVKFIFDLLNIDKTDNGKHKLPMSVYVDGVKYIDNELVVLELQTNPNLSGYTGMQDIERQFCGLVFSPQAYNGAANSKTANPSMYVDNVIVDYVKPVTPAKDAIIYDMCNDGTSALKYTLIVAAYDDENRLIGCAVDEDRIAPVGRAFDSIAIEGLSINDGAEASYYELFAWDSFNRMIPLGTVGEYTVPAAEPAE